MAPLFVGRETELTTLTGALNDVRDGHARVVVVAGDGGIGKSALLARLRDVVENDATRVLEVSGDAAELELPLGVVEQLLRRLGRTLPGADHIAAGAALLDALVSIAGDTTVIVIVDDAHWSDAQSLAALAFVARRLVDDRVFLLLATRSIRALPEALMKTEQINLVPLTVEELAVLAAGLEVELSSRAAKRLREHTAGNPLYARELLLSLPADAWRDDERPLPAPGSFAAFIAGKVEEAAPETRALVEAAAVLGSRPPLAIVARLAGVEDALHALDEACAAGLLTWDGVELLGFPHPLIPAAIADGLGAAAEPRCTPARPSCSRTSRRRCATWPRRRCSLTKLSLGVWRRSHSAHRRRAIVPPPRRRWQRRAA